MKIYQKTKTKKIQKWNILFSYKSGGNITFNCNGRTSTNVNTFVSIKNVHDKSRSQSNLILVIGWWL